MGFLFPSIILIHAYLLLFWSDGDSMNTSSSMLLPHAPLSLSLSRVYQNVKFMFLMESMEDVLMLSYPWISMLWHLWNSTVEWLWRSNVYCMHKPDSYLVMVWSCPSHILRCFSCGCGGHMTQFDVPYGSSHIFVLRRGEEQPSLRNMDIIYKGVLR